MGGHIISVILEIVNLEEARQQVAELNEALQKAQSMIKELSEQTEALNLKAQEIWREEK